MHVAMTVCCKILAERIFLGFTCCAPLTARSVLLKRQFGDHYNKHSILKWGLIDLCNYSGQARPKYSCHFYNKLQWNLFPIQSKKY